ncbi:MAG: hypothetical protein RQ741_01270 [Wenzhouxiangellaceae bacterium]|nr:hypothetical protein [Wenzhouxiangellaceae bacterium]
MTAVQASAPGKLMLIGEYAVLHGAPAVVMAVDRRARISVSPAAGAAGCLTAPQLGIRDQRITIERGQLDFAPPGRVSSMGMTARFLSGLLEFMGLSDRDAAGIDLCMDSAELFEVGPNGKTIKLGLGSSAAICAALGTALARYFGHESDQAGAGPVAASPVVANLRLREWLPLYRQALQAGASGADLAASLHGGVGKYVSALPPANEPAIEPVFLSPKLQWLAVWTGQAAQTTDFVSAFERWRGQDPGPAGRRIEVLSRIAVQAAGSLDDADGFVEVARDFREQLAGLGAAMGLEIMTVAHRRLAALADSLGLVYKSCGAGGGDLGIVLGTRPERIEAFRQQLSPELGLPLNLELDAAGAQADTVPGRIHEQNIKTS